MATHYKEGSRTKDGKRERIENVMRSSANKWDPPYPVLLKFLYFCLKTSRGLFLFFIFFFAGVVIYMLDRTFVLISAKIKKYIVFVCTSVTDYFDSIYSQTVRNISAVLF
jgi:hypothetical protein